VEPMTPSIRIDRSSPVPLYFQVAQRLEQMIESGDMPPGSRLENEIAMADRLGLSRPTMRQAIQHLVDRGLLVRKRGVGTQVVHARVRRQIELSSLFDDLDRARRQPRTEILSFGMKAVPDHVAVALRLPAGAEVVTFERLRYAHDEPLALMRNYVPVGVADLTADALTRHGLYQLLRAAGVQLRIADQTVSARKAGATEARLLHETRGAPLLTMQRTAYDHANRAVEYGSHVYRASRYTFEFTLVAR
jgi:DNA-binding GntR family transcriptional regulator